jgi:hypothetical protein
MSHKIYHFLKYSILFLLLFAWWSSLTIGLSTDEYFHHINGLKRFNYLISFGQDKNFNFGNNELYPGLYDTLSYALSQIFLIINKNFYVNNIDFVMHLINVTFSSLSILGLYKFSKKIFNQDIAIISVFLTLANPFFFGHMGMNSKDIIIFFSLIWSSYYFYFYFTEGEKFKDLILASFFVGFGCGVRLPFLLIVIPVIFCGLIFLISKHKSRYFYLIKRLSAHLLISLIVISLLIIICWPHMITAIQNGVFVEFLNSNISNSIQFHGPRTGLIDGEYYEVFNTPKNYFLQVIFYRFPFYYTICILISYFLIFFNNFIKVNEIDKIKIKFLIINIIIFFPILITLTLNIGVYDNIRLFLFTIPFFSIIGSFSLFYLIKTFKNSWKSKTVISLVGIFFLMFFYRFALLTPYHYDYVNYYTPKFKNIQYKWEHDYWGASYKELVLKIKNSYTAEEIKDLKILNCVGDDTLIYYLYRNLGINKLVLRDKVHEANHVILINRASLKIYNNPDVENLIREDGSIYVKDLEKIVRTPGVKSTCNKQYLGDDVVVVSRNGVILSALRKLE